MGEHKVKPIPDVIFGQVVLYRRRRHELEINTITVAPDHDTIDGDMIGFPGVDSVAGILFITGRGLQCVVAHTRMRRIRKVDPEEDVLKPVVPDGNTGDVEQLYRCQIVHAGTACILKDKSGNGYIGRRYRQYLILAFAVEYGLIFSE